MKTRHLVPCQVVLCSLAVVVLWFDSGGSQVTMGVIRGMVRNASAAAVTVTRLAAVATATRCAAWARKGPATEPLRVAAASPVRNTALTRPSTAPGITRCRVVCWITSDMEPDMATAAAAGSAVASDDEVNSRKYAPAVAVRLAV